jgi:hypothetical protein
MTKNKFDELKRDDLLRLCLEQLLKRRSVGAL